MQVKICGLSGNAAVLITVPIVADLVVVVVVVAPGNCRPARKTMMHR
jgi:phosphoribosylanthranilate isomerase